MEILPKMEYDLYEILPYYEKLFDTMK